MTPSSFDAFISYRRSDGHAFARRLRRLLQEYRPPRALRDRQPRPLKIYLDTIYEQGTNDFFESVTLPALLESHHLIVVATPDAADRGPDRIDWIRREIDAFERGPNAGKVLLVRALPGIGLPGGLEERYPNIEIIDLQGLGPLSFLNPAKAARLADETVKLLAPILGFGTEDMPALRREEERRQQVRLGLFTGAATAVVAAVFGLAVFAFESRNRALDALSRSMFATDRVIQSVSGSLPAGESRSNLMSYSCDLLDSLRDDARTAPRAYSMVLCAIERAETRDRLGEHVQAAELIQAATSMADAQFREKRSDDDALAVLAARRAAFGRAIAHGTPESRTSALMEFITSARAGVAASGSEWELARYAAEALQTMAVSLGERKVTGDAATAIDAAIELGQIAVERGNDLGFRMNQVMAIRLKATMHRALKETKAAAEADLRSLELFSRVRKEDAESQGLGERFEEVAKAVRPVQVPGQKP